MAVKITNNDIEGFVDEPYFSYDSSQDTFDGTTSGGVDLLDKGYVPLTGTTVGITIELIDVVFNDLNQNRTLFDIGSSSPVNTVPTNLSGFIDDNKESVRLKTYASNVRQDYGFNGLNDGNPHHIIFSFDDANNNVDLGYIIVDGTLINSNTTFNNSGTVELDLSGGGAYLGRNMNNSLDNNGNPSNFNGSIGRIYIYNKAVSNIGQLKHLVFNAPLKLNCGITNTSRNVLDISLSDSVILPRLDSEPSTAPKGTIFYDNRSHTLKGYDGSRWQSLNNDVFGNDITYIDPSNGGHMEFYVDDGNGNSIKKVIMTQDGSMGVNYQNANDITNKVDISGTASILNGIRFLDALASGISTSIKDDDNTGVDISYSDSNGFSSFEIEPSSSKFIVGLTGNAPSTKLLLKDMTMNVNSDTKGSNRVNVNGSMAIGYNNVSIPANSLCVEEKVVLDNQPLNTNYTFQCGSSGNFGIKSNGDVDAKDLYCNNMNFNHADVSMISINSNKIIIRDQSYYSGNRVDPIFTVQPESTSNDICFNCMQINDDYGMGISGDEFIIRYKDKFSFNFDGSPTSGFVFDGNKMYFNNLDIPTIGLTHTINLNNGVYVKQGLDASNVDVSGNVLLFRNNGSRTIGDFKFTYVGTDRKSNIQHSTVVGNTLTIKSQHFEINNPIQSSNDFTLTHQGIQLLDNGLNNNIFADISSVDISDSTTTTSLVSVSQENTSESASLFKTKDSSGIVSVDIQNKRVNIKSNVSSGNSILNLGGHARIYPKGSIMMIPVTMDVPPGWVLCDGNNTTPQLCDASYSRFPRGSVANTNTNGGSSNIDTNHIPAHSHEISSNVKAHVDISNSGKNSYLIAEYEAGFIVDTAAEGGNGAKTCSKYIIQNSSGQTNRSLIGIEQFSFRKQANDQNITPFNTPNYDLSVANYGNNTNSLNRYLPPCMPFKFIKYTG